MAIHGRFQAVIEPHSLLGLLVDVGGTTLQGPTTSSSSSGSKAAKILSVLAETETKAEEIIVISSSEELIKAPEEENERTLTMKNSTPPKTNENPEEVSNNQAEEIQENPTEKEEQRQRRSDTHPTNAIEITKTTKEKPRASLADIPTAVHFLNNTHLTIKDSFSASWLQSRRDFMEMNLNSIGLCEDAAFKAWSRRMEKLRQPLDLLDFSVEHLSKWWAMLDIHKNPIAYQSITSKLEAYIEKGLVEFPTVDDPVLKHTIAMIAFMPIRKGNDERSRRITMLSLGSTLESLRRAEMGRVVVVMLDEEDESYALETFQYLAEKLSSDSIPIERHNNNNNNVNAVTKIGHMEVAFVKIPKESTKTHIVKVNMPYGCLAGIRKAIFLAEGSSSLKNDNTTTSDHTDDAANPVYVQRWFGSNHDPSYYQYLYLTEPDSILQSRPSTLKQIKQEVDQGGIVAPHRLQPIPHESDLRGLEDKSLYLNEKDGFEEVLVLDAVNNHDVCCDDTGANKPGMNSFPKCPKNFRWWSCGLRYKDPNDPDPQKRLRPYKLIRLAQGVGLTTIAGTLHARRCIPGTTSYCRTLSTTSKSGKY